MNKRRLAIIIAASAIILSIGIGKLITIDRGKVQNQNLTPKIVRIIYWSNFPEEIFHSFSKENPSIKIDFERFNGNQYRDMQRLRISSGESLDLMEVMENDYIDLSNKGYLENLTEKTFLNNYKEDSISALAQLRADGRIFSVPYKSWVLGIWYNKTLFDKFYVDVPGDYQEFLETCRLLKYNSIVPIVIGARDNSVNSNIFNLRIWKAAGYDRNWFRKLNADNWDSSNPGIAEAVKDTQSFIEKDYLLADSINLTAQQAFSEFLRGRTAMCLADDETLNMIEPGADKSFEPGVFAIPYNNSDSTTMVPGTNTGFLIGIFSGSQNKKESEQFLQYISRVSVAQTYVNETKAYSNIAGVNFSAVKYNNLWGSLRMSEYITPLSAILSKEGQKQYNKAAIDILLNSQKFK